MKEKIMFDRVMYKVLEAIDNFFLRIEKFFIKKKRKKKMKTCKQCKKEFEPKDELDLFCSQDCKEEALAELDSNSDECLSCQ